MKPRKPNSLITEILLFNIIGKKWENMKFRVRKIVGIPYYSRDIRSYSVNEKKLMKGNFVLFRHKFSIPVAKIDVNGSYHDIFI